MITENHIRRICQNESTLLRGQDIARHNGVRSISVFKEMGTYTVKGYVQGSRGNTYYNRIEIEENGQIYCECDCPAYHTYRGACKHNVGMLYKFMQGMREENLQVRDIDEVYGKALLDFYEQELIKDIEATKREYIQVEPKLYQVDEDAYTLGIAIGEERMYVVKNMVEFVNNILDQNHVSYGKNLAFIHHIEAFTKEAQTLIKLIIDQVVARQSVVGSIVGSSRYSTGDKKTLPLSPEAFNRLFDLYLDKELNYETDEYKGTVSFIEGNPQLQFEVEKQMNQFSVRMKERKCDIIDYPLKKYIGIDNKIYRCELSFGKKIIPLLNFMRQVYPPQLKFDENGWKRFVISVLPKIKKEVGLKGADELVREYAPPELTIRMFLDKDEQGRISGQIEFDYEGYKFNPYDQVQEKDMGRVRDVAQEHAFNQLLEIYEFKAQKGQIYLQEEDHMYRFLTQGINDFIAIAEVHVTDQLKRMNISKPLITNVGLKVNGNLLQVDLGQINMSVQEIEAIIYAYKLKNKYYRLKDGRFLDLGNQGMDEMIAIVDGLGLKASEVEKGMVEVPLYKSLYLDQVLRNSTEINAIRDKYFKQIVRTVRNVEDTDFEVPETLKPILRGYQKIGFRWLKTMASYGFGGVLADDMGLGKTLQVIAVLLSEEENKGTSLVVAPTSLVLNWEREISKFAPMLNVGVVNGGSMARREKLKDITNKDVLITSYDSLKRDLEHYKDVHFRFCIADEAHYIKNPTTQNAKALKEIRSDVCFALTGTPIENSLAELWSLFDFIMPNYLFNYQHFKGKFETPIMRAEDTHAMKYLQKLISPFILRRLKKEVLKELPEKTETIIYNQMEEEQERLYKANVAQVQEELAHELAAEGLGRSHIKILAMLTRLRQICCHPGLYIEDYEGGSSKLSQCMELVEEAIQGQHKILIFSQFTTMLDKIAHELAKRQIDYYKLTGSTKVEERLQMVEAFNQDTTPVFLISLKAGGTGLNLTGADIVIHYDPWWNVTSENQATDRAYRLGQDKNVQVFKLITQDTIEEKIKKLQDKKLGLADELLTEGSQLISKMTEEEIKSLFIVN